MSAKIILDEVALLHEEEEYKDKTIRIIGWRP